VAICKYCEQEMNTADGCVKLPVKTIDGNFDPIPYGSESGDEPPAPGQRHHGVLIDDQPRCHDCAALPGHYHHAGCDWEECPRCHKQLLGCECEPVETESEESTSQTEQKAEELDA
jgi:hypothetical protein